MKYKGLRVDDKNNAATHGINNFVFMDWLSDHKETECLIPTTISSYCDIDTPEKCDDCIFHLDHQATLLEYLVENKHITEGQALQLTLDTK